MLTRFLMLRVPYFLAPSALVEKHPSKLIAIGAFVFLYSKSQYGKERLQFLRLFFLWPRNSRGFGSRIHHFPLYWTLAEKKPKVLYTRTSICSMRAEGNGKPSLETLLHSCLRRSLCFISSLSVGTRKWEVCASIRWNYTDNTPTCFVMLNILLLAQRASARRLQIIRGKSD